MRPESPLACSLLYAIRFYQRAVSPALPSACRFQPTCSQYAYEAIARFGPRRGGWLALRRLLRCTPLSTAGYDPVPSPAADVGSGWRDGVVSRETHVTTRLASKEA